MFWDYCLLLPTYAARMSPWHFAHHILSFPKNCSMGTLAYLFVAPTPPFKVPGGFRLSPKFARIKRFRPGIDSVGPPDAKNAMAVRFTLRGGIFHGDFDMAGFVESVLPDRDHFAPAPFPALAPLPCFHLNMNFGVPTWQFGSPRYTNAGHS